jgi:hypothetical protein
MTERIVMVGGPRVGKSTLAETYRARGIPVRCGDPLSEVKEPIDGVIYLPEGLGMGSDSSQYVVDHWFTLPGPWVCEGHVMARACRKWMALHSPVYPADRIIVFTEHHPEADVSARQAAMHRGIMTQWEDVACELQAITEYR